MPPLNPDFATAPPAPPLRPYISHSVGFRALALRPNVHSGLPSRHPGLVISLGDPIDLVRMPAAAQAPAALTAFVSGLQAGPTRIRYGDRRDGLSRGYLGTSGRVPGRAPSRAFNVAPA